ncbi:hypothetical protein B0A55_05258 [Friedmanniomyces simplex]|uniref:Uncharacterized protein n=1 Tax=Friedmanniomyces simplex TaxID=329884 RepID=A0A4U0XJ84_9PEZI|nr:hypothetical protein B0A55_05258 [Friedmanniomyces simplex]
MTSTGLLRTLFPLRQLRTNNAALKLRIVADTTSTGARCDQAFCQRHCRCFAHVNDIDRINRDVWFTSTIPRYIPPGHESDHKPPDERTLQLGKTVRILHDRLPTLLQSPLPAEILSPQISLHLFPSTHPHLPTVSGRIAYNAALWTAPVAWGRIPLVGNVKLTILSERMVRHGGSAVPLASRDEKLIVKWKTCGKTRHRDPTGGVYRSGPGKEDKDPMDRIMEFIAGTKGRRIEQADMTKRTQDEQEQEFCGLFLFEFDEKGRIIRHVIEHTDEGGRWDSMTRVVSVTDWLLGRFNGRNKEQVPELALCEERPTGWRIRPVDRQPRLD